MPNFFTSSRMCLAKSSKSVVVISPACLLIMLWIFSFGTPFLSRIGLLLLSNSPLFCLLLRLLKSIVTPSTALALLRFNNPCCSALSVLLFILSLFFNAAKPLVKSSPVLFCNLLNPFSILFC